ncbi:MAG TPA: hypothetical protein VF183_09650 [Acidimicrobiales bacterium]
MPSLARTGWRIVAFVVAGMAGSSVGASFVRSSVELWRVVLALAVGATVSVLVYVGLTNVRAPGNGRAPRP